MSRTEAPAGPDEALPTAPTGRPRGGRIVVFAVLCALCGAGIALSLLFGVRRAERAEDARPVVATDAPERLDDLLDRPHLVFRSSAGGDGYGRLAVSPLDDPSGARVGVNVACDVVHAAGGAASCLSADRGVLTTYEVLLLDDRLQVTDRRALAGLPSRTRVSPDGRHAATTVFVTGHSYAVAGFSTETRIFDLTAGADLGNLEDWEVVRDGGVTDAPDHNFWGVTFADDGRRFYATLGTGGRTYLVEGDIDARRMTVLRDNVECPSLSPDGARIAFKKRVTGFGPVRWRLHVLDLATMADHPLAEERNVDDQVEWLSDDTVAYAVPEGPSGTAVSDIWATPADGRGTPRRIVRAGSSPAAVRTAGTGSPSDEAQATATRP